MAILSTIQKIEPYIKTATGYVKQLLSADHVITSDKLTLQNKLNAMDTSITNATNTANTANSTANTVKNSALTVSYAANNSTEQLYTFNNGKIKIWSGSKIVYVNNANYFELCTNDMLKQKFGLTTVDIGRLHVSATNGDGGTAACRFYMPEYWSSGNVWVYMTSTITKNVRVNYKITYIYP